MKLRNIWKTMFLSLVVALNLVQDAAFIRAEEEEIETVVSVATEDETDVWENESEEIVVPEVLVAHTSEEDQVFDVEEASAFTAVENDEEDDSEQGEDLNVESESLDASDSEGNDVLEQEYSVQTADAVASDLTMENHTLVWVSGSQVTEVSEDKKQVTVKPISNSPNVSLKAKVTYSCGGNEGVETGEAEIRIPKNVFVDADRNKNATTNVELSIPLAPATGGSTSFHYSIETIDGVEYIVIRNYRDIPPGGFFMTADIVWNFNAVDVHDGFSLNDLKAEFSTQGANGGDALTAESDPISATVETKATMNSSRKEATAKKENWQSEWGTKPADADDYFYVEWTLTQNMDSNSTSIYDLYIRESLESLGEGSIVTWKDESFTSTGKTYYLIDGKSVDQSKSKKETLELMNSIPVAQITTLPGVRLNYNTSRKVIVKYPKTMVQNATPTITNTFTSECVTPEGKKEQKAAIGSYVYQAVQIGVNYAGDSVSMYKRANYAYKENSLRNYSYTGGVNMLRKGISVASTWSIDVKNMGWNRTENGTKTYDTVLRDGMQYIAGERLVNDDYDLTGFYPMQYDVYAPVHHEDTGDALEISTDYNEEVYGSIKVEAKDNTGNWSVVGTVTKIGEDKYHWVGEDGTVKDYTSYYSSQPIPLPEGTKDVRFTHTGKGYGVEFRMALHDKLNPTEHVMNLIGENTTQFDVLNIAEAYGKQDDKIYTLGNQFNAYTTPGIKEDIEKSDSAEFGATNAVLHDYSSHRYTGIAPTSTFSKTMGTPVNDKANARVKIPVNLRWDHYFNYGSLGVTVEEAKKTAILNESRDVYFYDLLPIGTTVDLNSINAKTYGNGVTCEYTVEMVNNWRDSGRTMMIINVKAPEGKENFYYSANYLDTGFIVQFDMYNSWENIEANGATIKNDAAMYSMDGPVTGGVSDTGKDSASEELFKNLGGGGGDADLENNVKYSSSSVTINVPTAAQLGFSKAVKGAGDISYSQDGTKVPATGAYSYQMRFSLQEKATAKDVIMYDVLESAYGDHAKWTGKMTGMDISQISLKYPTLAPVVYYSTSKTMKDLADGTGTTDFTDLTNTELWTTTAPADLSTVTAIAIDLSKDKNGNAYTFEGPASVSAEIFMEAVANYKDYIDNKETTDVDETTFAYNKAYIKQGGQNMEGSNTVTVEVEEPKAEIVKKSDPESGTETNRTQVAFEEPLTYTLDVRNKNIADAMKSMTVEDVIPEGLTIQEDQISYYFGSAVSTKTTVGENKRVQAKVEGQKITFTIDSVAAKEVVHLIIPTIAAEPARGQAIFDNVAKITGFNGAEFEYTSNKTYHEGTPVLTDLSIEKIWEDNNNAYGLRVPVTMRVLADDVATEHTMVLNEANQYKATITGLNKYQTDGVTEITYRIEEETVVNGYPNPSYGTKADGTLTVTNTAVVEDENGTVSFKLAKYKKGTNQKVEGVVFGLYDGNTKLDTQTTDANGEVIFHVNVENDHGDYDLSVKEESVPNGYVLASTPFKFTLKKSAAPTYTATTDKILRTYGWTVETDLTLRNGAYVVENEYNPTPITVPFTLSKKFADNTERSRDLTFTFHVTPEINSVDYPKPDKDKYTLTVPMGTSVDAVNTTGNITFSKPGMYTYSFTEVVDGIAGVSYALETGGAKPSYTMHVEVVDNAGDLQATVTFNDQSLVNPTAAQINALFVNKFEYEAVEITPVMEKAFTANSHPRPLDADGKPMEKDFEFVVEGITGDGLKEPILPTKDGQVVNKLVVNGAGSGTLPTLTFREPGTYKYKVTESAVNGNGYENYDKSYYEVTVEVKETMQGSNKLEAGVVTMRHMDKDGNLLGETDTICFTNEYIPHETTLSIPVKKIINGNTRPTTKDFTFTLMALNADSPLPQTTTVTINDAGEAAFKSITFTKAGTYYYIVTEETGNKTGYTYDRTAHVVTVEVTDVNGQLTASWKLDDSTTPATSDTKVEFINLYQPEPVELTIPVKKAITGNVRPSEKTFTFTLSDGVNTDTTTVTGEGSTSFESIRYTEAGTYNYTVREENGNEPGYTYSSEVKTLAIEVVDNNGVLEVTADSRGKITEQAMTFTNTYKPDSTSVELELIKKFTDDSQVRPTAKTFTFTLVGPNVNETLTLTPDAGDSSKTASDKFSKLTYTEAGTYTYTITEDFTGLTGFSSANPTATVTVTVTDNNGKLIASVNATEDDKSVIVNRYVPTPVSMDLGVRKVFNENAHNRPEGKTFTFTVTPEDDAPRFDDSEVELEFEAGDASEVHEISFGTVTFTTAGIYTYTIHEVDAGDLGYTYALDQTLTVEVVDNDGALEIQSRDLNGEESDLAIMENNYAPNPVDVTLSVMKKFKQDSNERPSEKSFSFELLDENGVVETVTVRIPAGENTASAQEQFAPLTFTRASTYTYTVREVDGQEPGYSYDELDHVITITISDVAGQLTPTIEIDGSTDVEILPIVNNYQPKPAEVVLSVEKVVKGTNAKDPFTFQLKAMGNNPMPSEARVTINGSGTTEFKAITFTKAGTYVYELSEVAGNMSYVYDKSVYRIVVTVVDHDGVLEATMAVNGATGTKLLFTNQYRAYNLVNTGDATHLLFYMSVFTMALLGALLSLKVLNKSR